MEGIFYVFNINAALKDDTNTWVLPPANHEIDLNVSLQAHSHDTIGDDTLKEIDVFKRMTNWDNVSKLGDKQAEDYFCSKECLLEWFKNLVNKLPNI